MFTEFYHFSTSSTEADIGHKKNSKLSLNLILCNVVVSVCCIVFLSTEAPMNPLQNSLAFAPHAQEDPDYAHYNDDPHYDDAHDIVVVFTL